MDDLKPKNKTLKVRIDGPTYDFLKEVADGIGITLSELVRRIIYSKIIEVAFKKKVNYHSLKTSGLQVNHGSNHRSSLHKGG